jgi:hypothetical protein
MVSSHVDTPSVLFDQGILFAQSTGNSEVEFLEFAGSHYLSTDHGASSLPPVARSIPYGEDRLDWTGSLNGTYRSADLRSDLRSLKKFSVPCASNISAKLAWCPQLAG